MKTAQGIIKDIQTYPRPNNKTKYIVELEEETGETLFIEFRQTRILDNYKLGNNVTVDITFEGTRHNGKYYNNIKAISIKLNE